MQKKLLLVIFLTLTFSTLVAEDCYSEMLRPEHYDGFKQAINAHGYVCQKVTLGHVAGQGSRGVKFRIICDDYALAYFVTTTSQSASGFCVEPWASKGQKCDE